MKKLVMRLDLEDDKAKKKAMKIVSTLQGIDSIVVGMKGKKMTVIGTVDPVRLVSKLKKYWQADIITVGLAKEPEKKDEVKPAAAEGKKEEGKNEEGKGEEKNEEGKKGDGGGKKEKGEDTKDNEAGEAVITKKPHPIPEHLLELIRARQYNPYMADFYFGHGFYEPPLRMDTFCILLHSKPC